MNSHIGLAASILVLGFVAFHGLASADTITIGTTNAGYNGFPFGCLCYKGEYQQVYNGALFSGPVNITGIAFFPDPSFTSTRIGGDFIIDLSTTSANTGSGPGGLSDTYANNIGANNAQFFSGTVIGVTSFSGGPFLYNPSQGNLLLDLEVFNNEGAGAFAAGCSTDTNRVFNSLGNALPTQGGLTCSSGPNTGGFGGLETKFTFTPAVAPAIPEPSTLPLGVTGLVILIGATRKVRMFFADLQGLGSGR